MGGEYYAAESHRRYFYNLFTRDYTYWNPQCTNFGVGPREVDSLSQQTGSVVNWFIGLIVTCFISMVALSISGCATMSAGGDREEDVDRKAKLIQTSVVLVFNVATMILAWIAWGKADEVDVDMI